MDRLLEISQELDGLLNRFARGEIGKDQLEAKREELHEEIKKSCQKQLK